MMRRCGTLLGLLAALTAGACGSRPGGSTDDLGQPSDVRPEPDLGPAQGLDVLFVGSQNESWGWTHDWAVSQVARLPEALAARLRHTKLDDVHLAVLSPLLPGKSRCSSTMVPVPATLFPNPQGAVVTAGSAGLEAWKEHASGNRKQCPLQNYLEAAALAIDGRNPGFPRPGALLLIVITTGLDDCSVQDMSLWDDETLWPARYNPDARCYAAPPGFLIPLASYPPRLSALHRQRTLVAVVGTNVAPDFYTDPSDPMQRIWIINEHCNRSSYNGSPRLASFVDGLQQTAHPRLRGLYIDIPCPGDQKVAEQVAQAAVDFGDL